MPRRGRPQNVRFRSKDDVHIVDRYEDNEVWEDKIEQIQARGTGAGLQYIDLNQSPLPSWSHSIMYRLTAALFVLAAILPLLQASQILGHRSPMPIKGVSAGVIPEGTRSRPHVDLQKRELSRTDVCFRWAQQSAVVNGTLYMYGGNVATQPGQTYNLWTNDFITIDLTKTWQTSSPLIKGLPKPPSDVPAVALGYLWNSYESLYLYGGEFSWKPPVTPTPFSLWEYHIPSTSWIDHSDPLTSAGDSAPDDAQPVQRAAEGAGASVPSLGRGFYFGGHLDMWTTPGWDITIARVYLQSLLEFTFPGYSNNQVDALSNGQDAGSDGVYRNITEGGAQAQADFTVRADGVLIYVPGFGDQGILLALGGGTNTTFTQMNLIDVYDIATSSWYKQYTAGPTPKIRVNPCAVIAVAQDGSSYNIYMFGGQNLIPAGHQNEYNDMWILTLPSFTWIKVNQGGQSKPYGRSGATCVAWDAQMVMVGGYLGNKPITCETSYYVFDLSNLEWVRQFTALSASPEAMSSEQNPLNQQPNQRSLAGKVGGLEGSYGYEVPEAVIKVVGGDKTGGATLTAPVVTATAGPLKTGSPITYTVTQSNGVVTTQTAGAGSGSSLEPSGSGGPNIAAIVVGVVCGLLLVLICYLLFCLFLYRKQLALYKRHVEMSQRQARGEKPPAIPGLWTTESGKTSGERPPDGLFVSGESSSKAGSQGASHSGVSGGQTSSSGAGYQSVRRSSQGSSTEDLLAGQEPTFVGVMLHPRRSLRVTNRD